MLVVGLVAVAAGLALALSMLGQVIVARHRAAAAADLAALAAARAANGPPLRHGPRDPCDEARSVAEANGAELLACRLDERGIAAVTVQRSAKVTAGLLSARAESRAGPAQTPEGDL